MALLDVFKRVLGSAETEVKAEAAKVIAAAPGVASKVSLSTWLNIAMVVMMLCVYGVMNIQRHWAVDEAYAEGKIAGRTTAPIRFAETPWVAPPAPATVALVCPPPVTPAATSVLPAVRKKAPKAEPVWGFKF